MKKYSGKNLYVGNLVVFPAEYEFLKLDGLIITNQKYIFEKINNDEYKEVFSGISTIVWPELSCRRHIPYIENLESISNYIPEFELRNSIDNVDLLVALDMINSMSKEEKIKPRELSLSLSPRK